MKISVYDDETNLNLWLPTNLIFGKLTVRLVNGLGRKYAGEALEKIPPEALEKLFAELRHIKKKYGSWDLVEVESADGRSVRVTL